MQKRNKILLIIAGSILLLVLLVQVAINSSIVQNKLKNLVADMAQEQLDAEVRVGKFRWSFPKTLRVEEVLVKKQSTDSLLYLGELAVTARLLPLLKKKLVLQHIKIDGLETQVDKLLAALPADTSQNEEVKSDESEATWTINVEELSIRKTYVGYYSKEAGMTLEAQVGEVNFVVGTLNMESVISVTSIAIDNTHILFQSYAVEETDTSSSSFAEILLEKAKLTNSSFTYIAEDSTLVLDAGGKLLDISDFALNLDQSSIGLDKGKTEDFHCDLRMDEAPDTASESSGDMNWGSSLWRIKGNVLVLDNFRFTMDDVRVNEVPGHFDPSHLRFEQVTGSLNDFLINTDTLILSIADLSGTEHHGLEIEDLDANFKQNGNVFSINGMQVKTNTARYEAELQTTINPTNYNVVEGKTLFVNLDVKGDNWHDIDYFYPLSQSLDFIAPQFLDQGYQLKTHIQGDFDHLHISNFNFAALQHTQLNFSGKLENLMSDSLPMVDIQLNEFSSSAKDIRATVKDLPKDFGGFSLPKTISIRGNYAMKFDEHKFAGQLQSSTGNMDFKQVKINLGHNPSYAATIKANLHRLSEINKDWVKASFFLDAQYSGKDVWSSKVEVKLDVDSFNYLHHTYEQLQLAARMDTGYYQLELASEDSALDFSTHAEGHLTQNLKSIKMDAEVGNLDFQVFTGENDSLQFAGNFQLMAEMEGEKKIAANLNLDRLDFFFSDSLYAMKPAKFQFDSDNAHTKLLVESYFYGLDFTADAYIEEVISAFESLPEYYLSSTVDTIPFKLPAFNIKGELEYPQHFASHFLPDLPAFDRLTVNGNHNPNSDQFTIQLLVPNLSMSTTEFDSVLLRVDGSSQRMDVEASTGLNVGETLKGNAFARGKFYDSQLLTNVRYNDLHGDEFLNFSALLDTINNSLTVHVVPDSLKLWYEPWTVDENNQIVFKESGIELKNIELKRNQQSIALKQSAEIDKTDIELIIHNLDIGNTGTLLNIDSVASGILHADILLMHMQTDLAVEGNLKLEKTRFYNINFGKVEVNDFQYNDSLVAANMAMNGENQMLYLSGKLHQNERLEADLDIQSLQLSALNTYLPQQIQQAKGILKGQLNVSGNTELPMLNGYLQFNEAGLKVLALNQYFSLGNDRIDVKDNVLQFSNFAIENERKQKAKVNGNISLISGNKVYNNLQVLTDNMEWINSTEKDNEILFGILKAQSKIQIKGPSEAVKIKANVEVDKATHLTYVFPDKLTIADNRGIVVYSPYVNDTLPLPETEENNMFLGFGAFDDVETRLEIKKGTRFKMHFDAGGENYLDAALNGVLNYHMKGINSEITGVFEIDQGKLHYNIPMVTVDNFDLEPGSTITLSNDIYNPYLNIIASSNIRASTEGLMADYKKVMTFKVLLYMEGELNNLKLRFDISTETGDAIVSSTLAQLSEKERNVNALNLLVRGTFELSLQSPGAGATSTAQAQIDKLYTDGLNSVVSDNIGFVDLHFDVQSFEDYGEDGGQVFRRNYYYEVGKSFFNERAHINYKGRLEMMDNQDMQNSNSSFVQNQLEVEFKVNKGGNLTAVFFRKDEYEGLLEGQVIETGLGFRLSNSFYSIKDIFVNEDNIKAKEIRDQRLKNEE